jgi:hypothetical protein
MVCASRGFTPDCLAGETLLIGRKIYFWDLNPLPATIFSGKTWKKWKSLLIAGWTIGIISCFCENGTATRVIDMGTFQDPAVFLISQRAGLARAIAAQIYAVTAAEMGGATRGRPRAARARQIAIHLARSVFDLSQLQLAAAFGRDRSTICHACNLIARLREDDDEFDSTLRWMESHLRRAAGLNP